MSFPNGTYVNQIQDGAVRQELEQLYSLLQGYLSVQHTGEGTHGAITAASLAATGPLSGSTGTFTDDVIADSDGTPVEIGNLTNGAYSLLASGGVSMLESVGGRKWAIVAVNAAPDHYLRIFDLSSPTTSHVLEIHFDGTDYHWTPSSVQTSARNVNLGDGGTTPKKRWSCAYLSKIDNSGAQVQSGIVSPAQITANQNNYNPTGLSSASLLRLDLSAPWNLTGIAAQADGFRLTLSNISGSTLTLTHADAASSVGNRFICPGGVNFALTTASGVRLYYDATSSFWRFEDK